MSPLSRITRSAPEVRIARRDPVYLANRAALLASKPLCPGFPIGIHGRTPVLATTADHRTPLSAGGTHDLANLGPMCNPCNARKGRGERRSEGWRAR